MSTLEISNQLNISLDQYQNGLKRYTDSQFLFKKDANTWSLAQMYEHICTSGLKFFLANTKRCLEKRNGQEGGEPNDRGMALIANGGFPDIKIKVPEAVKTEIIPRSIAEYKIDLETIRKSVLLMLEAIETDTGTYTIAHPVMGNLNAYRWLQNLEFHMRHHLKQLKELELWAMA
jgi:hypothetical protein